MSFQGTEYCRLSWTKCALRRTLAEQLGVHHEVVRRAVEVDAFVSRGGGTRPSDLDPYLDFIRETLERHPRLTGTRVHEMLRLRGYTGSTSQVRRRIRQLSLRPSPVAEAFLRMKTLPGEQAQVDWAPRRGIGP